MILECNAITPEIQESTVIPEDNESKPTQNQTGNRDDKTHNYRVVKYYWINVPSYQVEEASYQSSLFYQKIAKVGNRERFEEIIIPLQLLPT